MAAAQDSRSRALLGFAIGAVAALLLEGPGLARADGPWLTGEPLREALSQKISVVWSNIPVRQALEGLCQSQKIALLLDRRIDPDRKIEFSLDDVLLADGLQKIAAKLDAGAAMLGSVAYFGPAKTAARLRKVAALRLQDANRLPAAMRSRWTEPRPWKWDDLTAPRDLLKALAEEGGVSLQGLDQVPADLWAHADLPPLNLLEKLTLVLAEFDLTYETAADGASIRIIAMPENLQMEGRGESPIETPTPTKPGHRVVVGEARKVYSLQVELPVGQLLQSLGPRMGLEIDVDKEAISAAGKSLDTKVKIDVKDASAEELLRAVLEPAGLSFTRTDNTVNVRPKP